MREAIIEELARQATVEMAMPEDWDYPKGGGAPKAYDLYRRARAYLSGLVVCDGLEAYQDQNAILGAVMGDLELRE